MSDKNPTCKECGDRRFHTELKAGKFTHTPLCVHEKGKNRKKPFSESNAACKFFHSWEEWYKVFVARGGRGGDGVGSGRMSDEHIPSGRSTDRYLYE